jgi:hypothetical protein
LGGVSFWVSFQAGRWFIATWAPFTYEVAANVDLAEVAIEAIRAAIAHPGRFYFDIDDAVKSRFGLTLVSKRSSTRFVACDHRDGNARSAPRPDQRAQDVGLMAGHFIEVVGLTLGGR